MEEYTDFHHGEKAEYVNGKLGIIILHNKFEKLYLNEVGVDYDATSLYPSAMWDKSSVYPKKMALFLSRL